MTETKRKAKVAPELSAFVWDDAFLLEEQLSEEERMILGRAQTGLQAFF